MLYLVLQNEKIRSIFNDLENANEYIDHLWYTYGIEKLKIREISEKNLKKNIDKLKWI